MKYFERNKDYKFELPETETFVVPIDTYVSTDFISLGMGAMTIKEGYAWDGSSIPLKKLARFITFDKYDPDKYCKEASLVHDALYQLMRSELLNRGNKDYIDRLYESMCIKGGMGKRQAAWRYWAVKTFGHRTLKPRHYPEKTILDTNQPTKN